MVRVKNALLPRANADPRATPRVGKDSPWGPRGLTVSVCETLAVRFLDSGQQHSLSLLWPFLQPSPWQLIAVGSCALQPVCVIFCHSRKSASHLG